MQKKGEWHSIHALKDCCAHCHGGNCIATDKDLAHEGLVTHPLEDIYTNCYHCHPNDYQERAARFAVILGVIPGSRPTATPVAAEHVDIHPVVIQTVQIHPQASLPVLNFLMGGMGLLVILLLGLWMAHCCLLKDNTQKGEQNESCSNN